MKKGLLIATSLAALLGMGVAVGVHSSQGSVEQVKAVAAQPGDAPFGVEADWKPLTDVNEINTTDFYMFRAVDKNGDYAYSNGLLQFVNGVALYAESFASARMFQFEQGTNGYRIRGSFELPPEELVGRYLRTDEGDLWVTDDEASAAEFDAFVYEDADSEERVALREHGQTDRRVFSVPTAWGAMIVNMDNDMYDFCYPDSARLELVVYHPVEYIYLDNASFYEGNERYAAYFYNESPAINEWVDFTWDAALGYNKVAIPEAAYENVILCRMNGATTENIWENKWNQTNDLVNHAGIYKPFSTSSATVDGAWEYVLTVGETSTFMIPNSSSEVKGTVTASAGDLASLKLDEATEAGTLTPQTKASNNIGSDYKIKVAGEIELFVAKSGWSTWASGYAPSSTKLQDFCDDLLALDCSATDLSGLDWDGLDDADQTAFNDAKVTLGGDVTPEDFGNVVNEAATRYALLLSKGATPIEGITVQKAPSLANFVTSNSNALFIVIIISVAATTVGGGLLLSHKAKKKHN